MTLKSLLPFLLFFIVPVLFTCSISAQKTDNNKQASTLVSDFSDRQAVIESVENFFIGDHTGSIKHKKMSMHEKGAYRWVNRDGEYAEGVFNLDSDDADPDYKEELLDVEIHGKLALARVRLEHSGSTIPSYKLLTLHKAKGGWKITSITWGSGTTH